MAASSSSSGGGARLHYDVTLELDSETGDVVLPFPAEFLKAEDWRLGDRLKFQVRDTGGFFIENLSKADRR